MKTRVLMLEDNPHDAELIEHQLRKTLLDVTVTRVESEAAFRRELVASPLDLILADYNLPGFDGMIAFRIARDLAPEIPFMFVSGSIGEERAIEALREGAADYILKDRPARLAAAVTRALAERHERQVRERMQQSLRLSEQRFYLSSQATRDVIRDHDLQTDRVWMNQALETEWGYAVEDVDSNWWIDRIHPDDRSRVAESYFDAIARGPDRWICEYRFRRADGSYGHIFDRGVVVRRSDGTAVRVISAMQDITERTRAMEALAEAQRIACLGAWSYTPQTKRVEWSDQTYSIYGIDPATTPTYELFLELVHPDDRDRIRYLTNDLPRLRAPEFECRIVRPDGSIRTIYSRLGRVEQESGEITRIVGTVQDITERRTLERRLEQVERVSSLGRVAATIAHEFNNLLMGIQPFAEVIRRRASDERLTNAADHILQSVARGRSITQDILRSTRSVAPAVSTFDIGAWLQKLANEITNLVGNQISVELRLPPEPLWARADPIQLQQVVLNLAINARDAMPSGGTLTLAAEPAANHSARVVVADTGVGIASDALPHIFEPLFTTKRTGTGLGLAVVQQIVTSNGGSVSVDSALGKGSCFRLEIPVATADDDAAR